MNTQLYSFTNLSNENQRFSNQVENVEVNLKARENAFRNALQEIRSAANVESATKIFNRIANEASAPDAILNRKIYDLASALLRKYPSAETIDSKFYENPNLFETAFRHERNAGRQIEIYYRFLRNNRKLSENIPVLTKIVEINEDIFYFLDKKMRHNKNIVLAALTRGGYFPRHEKTIDSVNEELRFLILENILNKNERLSRKYNILCYTSDVLRNDKDVLLTAVTLDGYALELASLEMRNNKKVVLAAVTQNGYALQLASLEMRNNKDVVLAAVKQNRLSLQFASPEMQTDKEVLQAVQ